MIDCLRTAEASPNELANFDITVDPMWTRAILAVPGFATDVSLTR